MMTFVEDIHLALISPRHNNFTVTVFAKNPAPYDMKCSLFLSFLCFFSAIYRGLTKIALDVNAS